MQRATPSEIAEMVDLHPNTVRNWADQGIIECKRDFRGWRVFPDPMKTVRRIRGLLNGDIQLTDDSPRVRMEELLRTIDGLGKQ
jgi:DNA-binding transcriptional MerR regulator